MKNLLFILLGVLFALNINAQNPVAVNDTFYTNFETLTKVYRYQLYQNDSVAGAYKIIDTVLYAGVNQFYPYYIGISIIDFDYFNFTPQAGFFGLDSLTYVLTDETTPSLYDTAKIYIYVKRKGHENLDLNNISARIAPEVLFHQRETGPAVSGFNVPKQVNVGDPYYATIYGANLWISGKDLNGNVKTFGPSLTDEIANPPLVGYEEGDAGPISDEYEFYSYKWDRTWKVSQSEINDHIAWFNNPSSNPSYVIPEAILSWPGNGYESGQAYQLAPFYDYDGDGNYDPTSGDYPLIKGQQAVYFIKNDKRKSHSYSASPLGVEIHGMAYAYDCPSDSAINNTIFLNYKIYNRSAFTYTNVYAGMWTDFDIGNSSDDYVACDVARGSFYGYNGDNDDEDGGGVSGYGSHPPAQSVVFLKGPKKDDDGIDNPLTTNISAAITQDGIPYAGLGIGYGDGIDDNEDLGMKHFMYYNIGGNTTTGDPNAAVEYYNYLQGKWRDGSTVYASDGVTPTDYMFYGDSDPLFWSTGGIPVNSLSETELGNTPGDRRGVGSTGPFTMQPGEMKELELAFVFGRDYQNTGNTAGVIVMQERIDSIRSYYLDDFQSVCGGTLFSINDVEEEENNLQVYPNPFNNQFMVNYKLENATAQLMVFNMYGKLVSNQLISTTNTMVDLSAEANGIYFVQITDGVNRLTKKLVKH
jgi:type IX secretion system substrate protein/Big-like domain-containing protein